MLVARTSAAAVPAPARQATPTRSNGSLAAARTKLRVTPGPVRTTVDVSATTGCGGDAPADWLADADADGRPPSAEAVPDIVRDHDGVREPVRVPDVVAVTGDLDTVVVGDTLAVCEPEPEPEPVDEPVDDDVGDEELVALPELDKVREALRV